MAFVLPSLAFAPSPCSAPAFCSPRRSHPAPRPSIAPFLSIVDDTLNGLYREAQRSAKREARRRTFFKPRFDVRERDDGYEIEAEVPGFEQENLDIEVADEHTLRITGNTEKRSTAAPTAAAPETFVEGQATAGAPAEQDKIHVEERPERTTTPDGSGSETGSVRSYHATVEDDFEDLGAEFHTPTSTTSTTSPSPKGKEKAVEPTDITTTTTTEAPAARQPETQEPRHPKQPHHRELLLSERTHGSFERTLEFPERIDGAKVRASLRNGVLYVVVPKAPVPEVRRIAIQ